jgi:guanylate kinase
LSESLKSRPGEPAPQRTDPNLFVLSAPSGGGKTSLVNALLELDPRVRLSISHTTRTPRPGEEDGVHYHFADREEFLGLVADQAFLEHAPVFRHLYGTGRDAVQAQLDQGFDVLLDIDWQGARQIRDSFPGCCAIFILPPSLSVLQERLNKRGQDSDEEILRRMQNARAEISHALEFDFIIINDNFELALEDLETIITQNRPVRNISQNTQHSLLAELLGKS